MRDWPENLNYPSRARPWPDICSIRRAKGLRVSFGFALRSVPEPLRLNLKGMRRIQYRWLRVADVFHLYYDMAIGGHQSRRGGATISKAAHLAAKNTKSLGTSEPTFWSAWKAFQDVAPLVTATVLIWDNARRVFRNEYCAAFRTHDDAEPITLDQLSPFHITLLMPDFVLAVARSFEDFALTKVTSRVDAGLDPETLWRIPEISMLFLFRRHLARSEPRIRVF